MKRLISSIALIVILCAGIIGVTYMYNNIPITYDGSRTDVYELAQDPSNYDTSDADGIANIIVKENLEMTNAVNNVTAIVFDFRGYDTMGEAFILIVSVTGALAILRKSKNRWEGDE